MVGDDCMSSAFLPFIKISKKLYDELINLFTFVRLSCEHAHLFLVLSVDLQKSDV